MNKTNRAKILNITLIMLAIILVASMMLSTDIAVASASGYDTNELWYFDEDYLSLQEIQNEVNSWDLTKLKSDPIIIAVIDTGIFSSHEIFTTPDGKNILTTNEAGAVVGYNADTGTLGNVHDDDRKLHGTAVSSIIAMMIRELGLEDYIKIYPIKANTINRDGNSAFSVKNFIKALDHATSDDNPFKADIVNISLGISKSNGNDWATNEVLKSTLKKSSLEALLFASAGNEGFDSDRDQYYPAYHDGVISVMSYDKYGNRAMNSNYGNYDLIAPGSEIKVASSANGYRNTDGTSLATAFGSISAALMMLSAEEQSIFEEEPSAQNFSRYLFSSCTDVVNDGKYQHKKLDFVDILTFDYNSMEIEYEEPTGIEIIHDAVVDDEGRVVMSIKDIKSFEMEANILPSGLTDPMLKEDVDWIEIETDIDGSFEKLLHKGEDFVFSPKLGGEIVLIAELKYKDKIFVFEMIFQITYMPYIAGEVRVVYADEIHLDSESKDLTPLKFYTMKKVKLGLTGLEYVDRTKEVKWFANDVYIASGYEVEWIPPLPGNYVVTAEYGEKRIALDHSFNGKVEVLIAEPQAMATMIIVGLLLVSIMVVIVVIKVRKNKEKKSLAKENETSVYSIKKK